MDITNLVASVKGLGEEAGIITVSRVVVASILLQGQPYQTGDREFKSKLATEALSMADVLIETAVAMALIESKPTGDEH